jgi:chromosome partitioning protein
MRTIALANQKGGCGKTTTAINLSACLAYKGKRVLLIDLDPQAHATMGVGVKVEDLSRSMYEVMLEGASIDEVTQEVRPLMDIAPAAVVLGAAEQGLAGLDGRENRLLNALGAVTKPYDYIIVDCPPSIGLLTFNALRACNEAIIPIEASFFSLWGVGRLLDMIDLIKDELSHEVRYKALCTIYDGRSKFSAEIAEDVFSHFKDRVYGTIIHTNVKLREAASYGMPITEYTRRSRGYREYLRLANEVLREEAVVSVEEAVQTSVERPVKETYGPVPVPGGVLFRISAPGAREVSLIGDFNGWSEPMSMNDDDEDGVWIAIARLDPGTYEYKFVIDGDWQTDPNNPADVDDRHGGRNSVVVVN